MATSTKEKTDAVQSGKTIEVPPTIAVRELADLMGISPIDLIKELMGNGIMANINQQIDFDTAAIVAAELGYEASLETFEATEEEQGEISQGPRQGQGPQIHSLSGG